MATMTESPHRTPNMPGSGHHQIPHQLHHHHQHHHHQHHHQHQHDEPMGGTRIVPIPTLQTSAPSPGDPMDITTPTSSDALLHTERSSPEAEGDRSKPPSPGVGIGFSGGGDPGHMGQGALPAPPAAAAAVSQPKIVQTAFIHKLYNMLEDQSIQHLISWSPAGDGFVMSPSADFSKVLAQYFKHTNISSFVRQLNMYGFHKVSDVFHTSNPDTSLWEFKHGTGNFKRGDLAGLREIKRRASRHALVHRGDYNPKTSTSQPGTPAEPMPMLPHPVHDNMDARLANIEHALYDLSARLQRSEENAHHVNVKNHALVDSMNRMLQFSQDLCRTITYLAPMDGPAYREITGLQSEIERHADMFHSIDESHEPPFSGTRQYFSNIDNAPMSPRQLPQDDPRRATLAVPQPRVVSGGGGSYRHRPPVPSNLSINPRRPYGSIGASTQMSPLRNNPPPPPPLAAVEPPSNLARRHTSADIRAHWQSQPSPLPFGAGAGAAAAAGAAAGPPPSMPWPPSPNRLPPAPEDQRIRDSLSAYSLQAASQPHPHSRPTSPPPPPFSNGGPGDSFGSWSWNSALRSDKALGLRDSSAPSTRRGSMAHILNPSDTAERDEEDLDPRGEDDRKRKRMG